MHTWIGQFNSTIPAFSGAPGSVGSMRTGYTVVVVNAEAGHPCRLTVAQTRLHAAGPASPFGAWRSKGGGDRLMAHAGAPSLSGGFGGDTRRW